MERQELKEKERSSLRDLGLSPYEVEVYLALLSVGSSTPVELVSLASCQVPRSRIYGVLKSLAKKGFASIRTGKPTVYEAVPPKVALRERIEALRNEAYEKIEETKSKVERVLPALLELSKLAVKKELEPKDIAWVYYNREQFRNRITDLIRDCQKSFLIFTSHEVGLKRNRDLTRVDALCNALKRGAEVKSIHGVSFDMDLDLYMDFIKKGAEHRVPRVELEETFWVIDGNTAAILVQDANRKFMYGLVVRNQFLSNLLSQNFEEHWTKSIPAREVIEQLRREMKKKSS